MKRWYITAMLVTFFMVYGCSTAQKFTTYAKANQPSPQILSGELYKPDGPGPFPAIVLLPGCLGATQNNYTMAYQLAKNGYVSIVVDSFRPRGIYSGVCSDGSMVGGTTRARDAYGALIHLQTLPFVDKSRIALIGWSHGGWPALEAVNRANLEFFPPDESNTFRAVVAFYPPCAAVTSPPSFNTDVLLFIGEKDDWTLPLYCKSMVKDALPTSRDINFVVYPGATHGFDIDLPSRDYLGYKLHYDPAATRDSFQRTMQFLKEHL